MAHPLQFFYLAYPGNDMLANTLSIIGKCHLLLWTKPTGRGTCRPPLDFQPGTEWKLKESHVDIR